ncbi:MAG: hypothetical protein B6244_13940 [Candidatus Cloacimonetes bacterium 4572_55]|nr:MAG: hypothetical protein B6244_13940 [Candidatus Cloacimonetes bacterium 4572_55]
MDRKIWLTLALILTVGVTFIFWGASSQAEQAPQHEEVDDFGNLSCKECHADMTPDIVDEWDKGMHGQVNIGCFVCHGDGEVEFYPQPTTERCIGCHSSYEASYEKLEVSSCFSCHQGHTLEFHH